MVIIAPLLYAIVAVVAAFYLYLTFRVDLQMMQQNSYRNNRYFRWWKMDSDYCKVDRIICLCVVLLLLSTFPVVLVAPLSAVVLLVASVRLLKRKYKKPLVFTKRVWRLFIAMSALSIVIVLAAASVWQLKGVAVALPAIAVISWMIAAVANWLLKPVEASINQSYYNDAKRRLAQMPDMKIIGITGSYGKTSTKHYLNRILSEQFDVLMTPGSFNTPMGVIRTVRELMKPYNEVFIVEMGAKQIGDIKEICDLVHPEIGILTAVGEQHLESFKTIENVQRTKFELVDALPKTGFAVLNNDFEYVANRPVKNVKSYRYAVKNTAGAAYVAKNIEYTADGTKFVISGEGKELALETKLVGECNISNLMGAVIVAIKLGMTDEKIRFAVSKIEQVEHRLNMKRTAGGVTIIDDAFNSNPDGSRMALDVLARMKGGKRIVVTPGMIELGEKQALLNSRFGEHIAETCDVAIVVGHYNREAILEGIRKSGKFEESSIVVVDSFAEAQQRLAGLLKSGDTVLYENDLPDTFK